MVSSSCLFLDVWLWHKFPSFIQFKTSKGYSFKVVYNTYTKKTKNNLIVELSVQCELHNDFIVNTVDNSNLFGDFIVDSATFIDKGTGTCSIAYSSSESGRSTALTVRLFLGAVLSVVFRLGSSVVRVRWFPPFSSAASDDMSSLPCPYILSLSLGNPSVE